MIRNCEEVGLFEDLQHVNPFDETFRRAVESDSGDPSETYDSAKRTKPKLGTQTTLEALTMHSEDTLHTPNVLPYLEAASSSNKSLKTTISLDDEVLQPIGQSVSKLESMKELSAEQGPASTSKEQPPNLVIQNEMEARNVILISTVAMPYLISTQPTSDTSTIVRPLKKLFPKKAPVVEHPIKEKLKHLILRTNKSTTKSTHVTKEEVMQNQSAVGKEKPKPRIRTTSESMANKKLFERNRAAAQRYREKVKKTQDFLRQRNAELEAENERLRTELKSLKSILTSHQDCSVTRASNQRIINLQTHYTIGNELKPSIFYFIDDKKAKKEKSRTS